MTWNEYICYSLGQYKKDVDKWQHTRRLSYITASIMQPLDVQESEFMPLPFDEKEDKEIISETELEEFKNQFRNAYSQT